MQEIVARTADAGNVSLSGEATADLKDRLVAVLQMTADNLMQAAEIVAELERRGEDLSDLRLGIVGYLRKIASGQLDPGVVVRFSPRPDLLRRIANLPITEQRRLATGEPVPLYQGDGQYRLVDPMALSQRQTATVFGASGIRTAQEQIVRLADTPAAKASRTIDVGHIRVDRDKRLLRIGRHAISAEDVLAALAQLRDSDTDDGDRTESLSPLKVTAVEKEIIRTAAAKSDCSVPELQRRALAACGYLSRH